MPADDSDKIFLACFGHDIFKNHIVNFKGSYLAVAVVINRALGGAGRPALAAALGSAAG